MGGVVDVLDLHLGPFCSCVEVRHSLLVFVKDLGKLDQ